MGEGEKGHSKDSFHTWYFSHLVDAYQFLSYFQFNRDPAMELVKPATVVHAAWFQPFQKSQFILERKWGGGGEEVVPKQKLMNTTL